MTSRIRESAPVTGHPLIVGRLALGESPGACMRASLTTITGVDLAGLGGGPEWFAEYQKFLSDRGWTLSPDDGKRPVDGFAVAIGPAVTGEGDHAMVALDGIVIWDPGTGRTFGGAFEPRSFCRVRLRAALEGDSRIREQIEPRLRAAAQAALDAWSRMPDAGLTDTDPRYRWWYDTARERDELRAALATPAIEPGIDEERLANAIANHDDNCSRMAIPECAAKVVAAYRATPADRERPE